MSRTFTKLFSSITESTVWCEPDRTRLVWICMLAMADQHGRVWGSIPGLANRARVPVEDARAAIDTFLAPDVDSRTKDFDGRRVEAIDGGWRLLNHEKYRAIRDEESIKESKRRYINNRRANERQGIENVEQLSKSVDSGRANAEADTEAEAYKKHPPTPQGGVGDAAFEEFWKAYPRKVGKGAALKAYKKVPKEAHGLLLAAVKTQSASEQWRKDGGQFIPHPATWLNEQRWLDGETIGEVLEWHQTRSGVEARGQELGVGGWDQLRQFDSYKADVMKAHKGASQ